MSPASATSSGQPVGGVHLEHARDVLALVAVDVQHAAALFQPAAVDADVGQVAVLVVDDLERQAAERLVGRALALDLDVRVLRIMALDRGQVGRRRQVVDDAVQQPLHADVLQRRAGEDRVELEADRRGAKALADLVLGDGGRVGQVLLHEVIVGLGDLLDQLVAPLLDLGLHVLGDRLLDLTLAAVLVVLQVVVDRDLADQVDHALEGAGLADGDLHRDRGRAEALADRVEAEVEVRAELVHLVDEADARDVVLGGLTPDGLGLGLDAFLAVEDGDRAVEHAHGALDLGGEVDVAGGVDQVDRVALAEPVPRTGGGGGVDGDAALLLLGVEVHGGGAFVHLAHLVDLPGVIEDALGDGGLAGVDVGGDADVTNFGHVAWHSLSSSCVG